MDEGLRRRLEALLAGGVAIIVATADQQAVPAITRGWGPSFDPASGRLALAVTARTRSPTAAQLVVGRPISVTLSEMPTYATVQINGVVTSVRRPGAADLDRAEAHVGRFVDAAVGLGIASGSDNLFLGDLLIIELNPHRISEQTPGEHAGEPLSTDA